METGQFAVLGKITKQCIQEVTMYPRIASRFRKKKFENLIEL